MSKSVSSKKKTAVSYQQLLILYRIYCFRFITTSQIQQVLNKKQIQQSQQRLNLLLKRGWIARNFSSQDRLTGQYASYYLLPAGIKVLKQNKDKSKNIILNENVLHNIYKDKTASKRFINHCLVLGDIDLNLKRLFKDKITYYDKSYLADFDYLPKPTPDGYIAQKRRTNLSKDYFLEYFEESVPFFVHQKRIKQYIQYKQEGDWEESTDDEVPQNRFVAETEKLQKKIIKYTINYLEEYYYKKSSIFITNLELLKTSEDAKVWYLVHKQDD